MPLLPGFPTLPSLTENRPTGLPGPPAGRTSLPNPPQHPKRATRRPSPLVTRAGPHHSCTKVRPQNELTGGRENRKGRGCESSPEPGSRVAALPAFPQYGARKSRRAWYRGGARMLAIGTAQAPAGLSAQQVAQLVESPSVCSTPGGPGERSSRSRYLEDSRHICLQL